MLLVVVTAVVVVDALPRAGRAGRQTSPRPDLEHVYDTRFTVRDTPNLVHFVPRMSGTTRASAGMARCPATMRPMTAADRRRFIGLQTESKARCDKL
jgi:hypothetical protein